MTIISVITGKLFRNLSWSVSAIAISAAMQFLQLAILGRTVPPEEFAILGIVNVIFSLFLIISDFGLVNYQLSHKESYEKYKLDLPVICIWVGAFSFALCVFLAKLIGVGYSNLNYELGVLIIAPAFFFNSLCSYWYGFYSLNLNVVTIGKVEIISRVISFAIFFLLVERFGVFASIISITAFYSAKFVFFSYIDSSFFRFKFKSLFSFQGIKKVFSYSSKQMSSQWLGQLSANLDSIIFSKALDSYWFGLYSAGKDLALKVSMLLNPVIARVCTPYLANYKESLNAKYLQASLMLLLVTGIGFFLLVLFSPLLVGMLFGQKYVELNILFPMFLIWAFLRMSCAVSSSALVVSGKVNLELVWNISMLIFWFFLLQLLANIELKLALNLIIIIQFVVSIVYIYIIQKFVLAKVTYLIFTLLSLCFFVLYGLNYL